MQRVVDDPTAALLVACRWSNAPHNRDPGWTNSQGAESDPRRSDAQGGVRDRGGQLWVQRVVIMPVVTFGSVVIPSERHRESG